MAKKSVVTEGYPTVKIAGKTYTLEPTLKAVRQICGAYGGILPAYTAVNQINPGAAASVIACGAGIEFDDQEDIDAFEEKVWKSDRSEYQSGIIKFLGLLLNGGKEIEPKEEKDEDEKKEADQGNG